jgi:hypothetical protein
MVKHISKAALILITGLLLVGCASNPPIIQQKIVYVDVPVNVTPKPPVIQKPNLYIFKLNKQDINNPGVVVQDYALTVKQLEDYSTELQQALNVYNIPKVGKNAVK